VTSTDAPCCLPLHAGRMRGAREGGREGGRQRYYSTADKNGTHSTSTTATSNWWEPCEPPGTDDDSVSATVTTFVAPPQAASALNCTAGQSNRYASPLCRYRPRVKSTAGSASHTASAVKTSANAAVAAAIQFAAGNSLRIPPAGNSYLALVMSCPQESLVFVHSIVDTPPPQSQQPTRRRGFLCCSSPAAVDSVATWPRRHARLDLHGVLSVFAQQGGAGEAPLLRLPLAGADAAFRLVVPRCADVSR
jgi:hypothetical protein